MAEIDYKEISGNQHPKLSIITASLNQGRFLRQMIESILAQTYTNYEHIVMDGGSTDNTFEILKEYPQIKWFLQKDNSPFEAFIKLRSLVSGEYVIQCCTSDGFLDKHWFQMCVDTLDKNKDISMVWGLPQYMTEDGFLQKITTPYYLSDPPPQKKDFLGFWLATGHIMYEGNQCTRRDVFQRCFPASLESCRYKNDIFLDFIYKFMTLGYLPYFLPIIASYGRVHEGASGQSETGLPKVLFSRKQFLVEVKKYRKKLFKGKLKHYLCDGNSQIIAELSKKELHACKLTFYKTKIKVLSYYSLHDIVWFILRKFRLSKRR